MDGAYVYLIRCADGSFYCGSTRKPIEDRFGEHEIGRFPTCYTFARRPLSLVWCEHFARITDAIAAERRIKGWSRAKKQALVGQDWTLLQALSVAYARRSVSSS